MRPEPISLAVAMLGGLWVAILFDPHWYVAARGVAVVLKLPVLLFIGLLITLVVGVPSNPVWRRRWQWYAPFLLYIVVGVVTLPWAHNIGLSRETTQGLMLWWALMVGSITLIGSVKRAETLVLLYGFQFLWWALWGGRTGLVSWHHTLSNYDGFGAFNVGGLGICYFLGMASTKRWLKWTMYATAGACAMGIVASFARGAFLAGVFLFFVIWIRSPHKGKTFFAGLGGVAVMAAAASLLFEEGFFWNEIMSAFHEGTTEGTGEDRMILWSAAWRVFLERPLFGAGPRNWGAVASTIFQPGELSGPYANPGALYNMSLHNLYVTTLSELGLVGCFALLWILVDFWRRNAVLRSPAAERHWTSMGGKLKLHYIGLGLEAAMVAFLVNALFYSMMGLHWFYTMLALNLVLHAVVTHHQRRGPRPRRASAAIASRARYGPVR